MSEDRLPPVHPGEVLRLDFLEPLGISQHALAKAIGVPPQRVLGIVHGRRAVTADTALRLGRYFGVEPQLWLNLQTRYDLDHAEDALGDRLGGHAAGGVRRTAASRCVSLERLAAVRGTWYLSPRLGGTWYGEP